MGIRDQNLRTSMAKQGLEAGQVPLDVSLGRWSLWQRVDLGRVTNKSRETS